MIEGIKPDWPAPSWIKAFTTLRTPGVSQYPYAQNNLAMHVGDNPEHVQTNRTKLNQQCHFLHEPIWLNQTHSTHIIEALPSQTPPGEVDGSWTRTVGLPCVVLTADCLPLLLCDEQGTVVSAVHCGWRGMLNGIIENAVQAIQPFANGPLLAWLGPAIGPLHFEVGQDVRDLFVQRQPLAIQAFKSIDQSNKWMANIYQLAKLRLQTVNVTTIYGGNHCTFQEAVSFYSYRREGKTGRMATFIWIDPT